MSETISSLPRGELPAKPRRRGKMAVAVAVAPFEAATVLAWVAVLVGTSIDWTEYAISSAAVLAVGILPLSGLRQFRFGTVPSAFLYLAAVALLRDSTGGISSGVAILSLVPVFYVALYGNRRALLVVVGGVAAFYLVPLLVIGPPAYPPTQYRAALLAVTVSAIIGLTTQGLVSKVRRAAQDARDREQMLEQVSDLVRGLLASPDARDEVCEAARRIGRASVAVLYEPDGSDGAMHSTAMAGIEARPIEIPAGRETAVSEAFASGRQILATERVEERVGSREFWEAAGSPSSVLYEPLLRGDEVIGVLGVGWDDEVRLTGPRVTLVALLAHEAAAVIDRADLLEQLARVAETDPLTGVPNRRTWDARLSAAVEEGRRFAVAILDLDRFKHFNDSFGHLAGDRLLKETTAAWRDQLRAGDTLARLGGEEFGLLLLDCDTEEATDVIDRLRTRVTSGQTCSAGLAVHAAGESGTDVMRRADIALYEAKDAGRDRMCLSS